MVTVRHLRGEIEACKELLPSDSNRSPWSWLALFNSLEKHGAEIADIVDALSIEHGSASFQDLRWWVGALRQQARSYRRDVMTLTPWGQLSLSPIEAAIAGVDEETKAQWRDVEGLLEAVPTLLEIPELADRALPTLAALQARLANSHAAGGHITKRKRRDLTPLNTIELRQTPPTSCCRDSAIWPRSVNRLSKRWTFAFSLIRSAQVFTIGYNVGTSPRQLFL